jgi:thiamine-monophosphate kinase
VAPPKPRPPIERPGGNEDAAVERIARALQDASGPVRPGEIWIGDDAAVVVAPPGRLVLATDAVVAGVHADLALVGPADLGWKALTSAVSDIGAMGARPLHALVTLCVPPGIDLDALARGLAEASAEWRCPVVGGDLSSAGQVVASVAVTGVLDGDLPPVTRAGASPEDWLLVTGPLGGSAAGLRLLRARAGRAGGAGGREGAEVPSDTATALVEAHRRPRARLAEGQAARQAGARAMLDVSDGLAIDLHRLADASGVGFRLDEVPVAAGATRQEALGGGEDYELVVATADPDRLADRFALEGRRPPLVLGRCTADPGERLLDGEPLPPLGWQHAVE